MQKHLKKLDWLIKYTVAAIILTIPLYPKFPFIRVPGTFVSIRLEDLIIAFGAVLLLVKVTPRIHEFFKDKLTQSVLLYLVVGFISLVSGIFVTKTVVSHIGVLHWARRIEYFVPLFLGIVAIGNKRSDLNFYFKLLLIVVFVAFLYGLGQRYLNWPIIITQNEEYSKGVALRWIHGSHINSTFAGHYDLATFLVLVMPMIVLSIFLIKNVKSKVILFLVSLAGLWLLVLSASRISLASYLISVSFALALVKKFKVIPVVLIISVLFIGFSSNLITRYKRFFDVAIDRVKNVELLNYNYLPKVARAQEVEGLLDKKEISPTPTPVPVFEDRSTNIRFNVEWPRAIRAFSKNPFLGTGYSSITLATDNDYLRLLGEVGILGIFAFFLVFLSIACEFCKKFPLTNNFKNLELIFTTGLMGSIPGLFINAVFIDIFEASKFAILFWLIVGMALGIVRYKENE